MVFIAVFLLLLEFNSIKRKTMNIEHVLIVIKGRQRWWATKAR